MEELYSEEYLSTREAASVLMVQPNTLYVAVCVKGSYFGAVPVQLPNKRLLWRREDIMRLLTNPRGNVAES